MWIFPSTISLMSFLFQETPGLDNNPHQVVKTLGWFKHKCWENKPKMAYSRDLSEMPRLQCSAVHTGAFWLVMLAAVAARHRTASRMRRFDRFQRNCIFSLSMHPKKLKLFVWPSNISAGVNLTLRLLAEPWREPSTVTSIPRAIVVPSTIVQWDHPLSAHHELDSVLQGSISNWLPAQVAHHQESF